jgi:hypothetical protein
VGEVAGAAGATDPGDAGDVPGYVDPRAGTVGATGFETAVADDGAIVTPDLGGSFKESGAGARGYGDADAQSFGSGAGTAGSSFKQPGEASLGGYDGMPTADSYGAGGGGYEGADVRGPATGGERGYGGTAAMPVLGEGYGDADVATGGGADVMMPVAGASAAAPPVTGSAREPSFKAAEADHAGAGAGGVSSGFRDEQAFDTQEEEFTTGSSFLQQQRRGGESGRESDVGGMALPSFQQPQPSAGQTREPHSRYESVGGDAGPLPAIPMQSTGSALPTVDDAMSVAEHGGEGLGEAPAATGGDAAAGPSKDASALGFDTTAPPADTPMPAPEAYGDAGLTGTDPLQQPMGVSGDQPRGDSTGLSAAEKYDLGAVGVGAGAGAGVATACGLSGRGGEREQPAYGSDRPTAETYGAQSGSATTGGYDSAMLTADGARSDLSAGTTPVDTGYGASLPTADTTSGGGALGGLGGVTGTRAPATADLPVYNSAMLTPDEVDTTEVTPVTGGAPAARAGAAQLDTHPAFTGKVRFVVS